MGGTLVIAELGSSWCFGTGDQPFENVMRLIRAAKECGADVAKMQWTSDAAKMAKRRGLDGNAANMYAQYLQWPKDWMQHFKAEADRVGIEWACTVYLMEDIATIAPLVKRFKVSAFESKWRAFVKAHLKYDKEVIASSNGDCVAETLGESATVKTLLCTSEYPCPLEKVKMARLREIDDLTCLPIIDGFSDHTANVLTGAAAVAAGARILEFHCRLDDTSPSNPDYGHSHAPESMRQYIANVRTVERML